ncbi:unnamed protein product [Polarella glacialis]|uniref:Uncharacterized protein n=1 Tax=Polarella glacialis TaxID=89957 RepID=A0A813ECL6_POLGL|nr:unnamed protein product [Polarella glacialis]CAE8619398.1 unnamed protein product [Polarella glacialis]
MRVCLRKHESGNPNMLLRADGKFKGVVPQDFLDFLLKPENLPGLQEYRVVETIPDGVIMYMRVKAPGMKARDHVWKYTIDKRGGGSIFVTIRTVAHDQCPVTASAIRAYYYNSSEFKMSAEEDGGMEMTEFIYGPQGQAPSVAAELCAACRHDRHQQEGNGLSQQEEGHRCERRRRLSLCDWMQGFVILIGVISL